MKKLTLVEYEYAVAAIEELEISKSITSRNADKIEDELAPVLHERIEFLLRENKERQLQIQDMQQQFGNDIQALIRVNIQNAFMEGAKYVGRVLEEPNIYISPENAQQIEALTRGTMLFFWRQVDLQIKSEEAKTHARATLTDEQFASYRKANPLLWMYGATTAAELVANDVTTSSVAYGTIAKARELKPIKTDYLGKQWRVVFVSRNDPKVCIICASLDYRHTTVEWDFGSPFIIIPRFQTHKRCRCRLMLKLDNRLYSIY